MPKGLRSNVYDVLPTSVENLKKVLIQQENIIQKANKVEGMETVEEAVNAGKAADTLCKSIYGQFTVLKKDYEENKIMLAQYRHNLAIFKNLLTSVENKIENKHLHAPEIAAEIKKHI